MGTTKREPTAAEIQLMIDVLRDIEFETDGEDDITESGGPNWAMRINQSLDKVRHLIATGA